MLNNLKALVVILALASAVFALARPICLAYMSEAAFVRRRAIWYALTIVAFVSPTFWMYALFAIVLLGWAAAKDEHPLALYAFIAFTIPDARFYIPGGLVQQLFDLNQYRILALVVITTSLIRSRSLPDDSPAGFSRSTLPALLLLAYMTVQVIPLMPYETGTNTLRRAFLLGLDVFVVVYAFSRLSGKTEINDVLSSFWLSCLLMAPIALFETGKGWLLYAELASFWGDPNVFAWINRGGTLRAQAAANHSLYLGYVSAVALGLSFYLCRRSPTVALSWGFGLLLVGAMYVSGSRAAWINGALVALVFSMLQPGAARRMPAVIGVGLVVFAALYLTPLRESVWDRLPIVGSADQENILYRQQLAEVSFDLIRQNPWFGDPFVYLRMEQLRQGQGIIDIVNGYLYTALFHGLVGLALITAVLFIALRRATAAMLQVRNVDEDAAALGASLVAVFLASLLQIAAAGYGIATYMLAGILISYAAAVVGRTSESDFRPAQRPTFSPHPSA